MEDSSQQSSQLKNSVGNRPLVPARFNKGAGSAATIHVVAAAATGLGLMAGVTIAIAAAQSHAGPPRVSAALGTHTSGVNAIPAVYTDPGKSLLRKVDNEKKPAAGPALLKAASKTAVSQPSAGKAPASHATVGQAKTGQAQASKPAKTPKKHRAHKPTLLKQGAGKHRTGRPPYVSPHTLVPVPPTSLDLAATAAANGPFFVGIEGELTVASYDGTEGKIETYEGTNFVLDRPAEAASAIRWEDFPFNVHYRCDESGKCTLQRGGATETARMTR